MQDPFADKSDKKLQREIQMWMAGLMCLLVAFLYLSFKRMMGPGDEIPAHIYQSGVAQVAPPLEHDSNPPAQLDLPQLKQTPTIPSGRFSADKKPVSPPASKHQAQPPVQPSYDFPNHRKPAETFTKAVPKIGQATEHPQPTRKNNITLPLPTLAPSIKANAAAAVNESSEAIGRRRARELAAITSGLPKRLNHIQSSIQQASADLPIEHTSKLHATPPHDNGFVASTLPEPAIALPTLSPEKSSYERIPAQPVVAKLIQAKPIQLKPSIATPTFEGSKPLKPLRTPKVPSSLAEFQPAKASPRSNSFQPQKAPVPTAPVSPLPAFKPLRDAKPSPAQFQQEKFAAVTPSVVSKSEILTPKLDDRPSKNEIQKQPVSTSKQHIVEAGDSFFTIAQQHYGDGQWFRALRLANQQVVTERQGLQPGMSLSIPATDELARRFPDQALQTEAQRPTEAERRIYVTQAGDTLFDIARRKTGQGSRFSEIIKHNQFSLPSQIRASDQLPADLRLVLPKSTLQ